MTTPPTGTSLEVRISRRLTADGSVIIPPRIARWLEHNAGMTADRRIRLRDNDPEAYVALTALHLSALSSESGTKDALPQRHRKESVQWLSTSQAADTLHVTDRCIRKWCTTGRLHAQHIGGRWLIDPTSITHENTTRTKDIA
ncbi:helix-turn-helix domain-containing protein [Rhodococcoides fascians]|uniref:helix-turn-helix domain-containing protein n=1 Tax=Rhodococcoides fascians TaxID=1828 RepID=UPI000691DC40|nr:helix-turn-helix domain-containing protein [Rhodococcus fascians]